MRRKQQKPYLDFLADLGVEVIETIQTKHIKVRARYRGVAYMTTLSTSPSDVRTWQNWRCEERRHVAAIDAAILERRRK